jgi:excisionase family DNA binding protein
MKILTAKQVATLVQAKLSTVYAWAEQGILPCIKIGGLLRFDEDEVIELIKSCKRAAPRYNVDIQARARKGGKKGNGALTKK